LPKNYLLGHPRPVLVKDFFDEKLIARFKMKKSVRALKTQFTVRKSDIDG